MKPIILTGDNCPSCIAAKSHIKEHNLDIEIIHIDPSTREGRDIQMQYRVMGIPTLLERDAEGNETSRQVGVIDFSKLT